MTTWTQQFTNAWNVPKPPEMVAYIYYWRWQDILYLQQKQQHNEKQKDGNKIMSMYYVVYLDMKEVCLSKELLKCFSYNKIWYHWRWQNKT